MSPMDGRRRKRWVYGVMIGVGVLAAGALIVNALIVSRIRSELESLVRGQLGGELKGVSIAYRPPYGAILRNLRIIMREPGGGERDLLRASRLDLRLERRPKTGQPVLIRSLELDHPVLLLASKSPSEPHKPLALPATISDKVQVRHLKINGGSIRYEDRNRPESPAWAVSGISIDVQPPQQPGGPQPLSVTAGGEGGSIDVRGTVQPDGLVLGLTKVAADLRLGAGVPGTSPFPEPVAAFVRRHRLGGTATVTGQGQIPLRHLADATFQATADVRDGSAGVPGSDVTFSPIQLQLTCDTSPAPSPAPADAINARGPATRPATQPSPPTSPPLHLKLAALNARCGQNTLVLTAGEFWHDPTQGRWKVAQLTGRLETPRAAEPSGPDSPAAASASALPATRSTRPAGRVDFTAAAGGPTEIPAGKSWQDVVRYELLAFPRDAVCLPARSWPLPFDHIGGGGQIRVADGVISVRNLSAAYGGDPLTVLSARVPLPKRDLSELWTVETRVEELNATLTCHQPGPEYPPDVRDEFAALRPAGTFQVGGRFTIRHTPPRPGERKPKGDFHFEVISDGRGAFAVGDHRIPLTNVRGRAVLDPLLVRIDPTEARSLGGTVTAEMNITPRTRTTPTLFQGRGWVRDVDMALLAKTLDLRAGNQTRRLSGRGYLDVRFSLAGASGPVPPSRTLRADGEIQILRGQFWDDPVLGRVVADVKSKKQPGLGDAAAVFSVADGRVTIHRAAINSPSVGVEASGTVSFDKRLDLQVVAVPIGDLREKLRQSNIPILGDLAGDVVGAVQQLFKGTTGTLLYQYRVTGPATNPTTAVVPAPALSDPAALLFGRMLKANPDGGDGRLLDAVRAGGQIPAAAPGKAAVPPQGRRGD